MTLIEGSESDQGTDAESGHRSKRSIGSIGKPRRSPSPSSWHPKPSNSIDVCEALHIRLNVARIKYPPIPFLGARMQGAGSIAPVEPNAPVLASPPGT
jgi:hypothetical protein